MHTHLTAAAILGLFCGGCGLVMPPEELLDDAVKSQLPFNKIAQTAQLALDLTNRNAGILSTDVFIEQAQPEVGSIEIHEVSSTAYALRTDDAAMRQLIILSGTTNLANNEINQQTDLFYDDAIGGRVHSGYRDLALLVREDLRGRLIQGYTLAIVGFSQGGGVAAILPLWLRLDGIEVEMVTTLGQPKAVDAEFAARVKVPLLRLVAADDAIVGFPFIDEYAHFGDAVVLLDGPYVVVISAGEEAFELPALLPSEYPDFVLIDHTSYERRLREKEGVEVFELPYTSLQN